MNYRKKDSARKRIFDAAQKLFAEKGFWGTSVQEITDRAKVNKAMLFYYYKSKENLYFSLLEDILGEILSSLRERMATCEDPLQKLNTILEIHNELCFDPKNFDMFKIIFQDIMGPGERVKDSLKGYMKTFLDIIASVIEEGTEKGLFKQVDPSITALSIIGICYMFARHRLIFGERFDVDDVTPYIHSLILKGIML